LSQSYSHVFSALDKYRPVLDTLVTTKPLELWVANAVATCWASSTQHTELILTRMVEKRALSAFTLIKWSFG
jgi:hypothetical protein